MGVDTRGAPVREPVAASRSYSAIAPMSESAVTTRRFRPRWWVALLSMAFAALTIHLGNWQGGKADYKIAQQAQLDAARGAPPMALFDGPQTATASVAQRYQPILAHGRYRSAPFFLDNRIQDGKAGYAVLQVLAAERDGAVRHVLVDRGWIAASGNHATLPSVETPNEIASIVGRINVATSRNPGTMDNDGKTNRLNYLNLDALSKQVGVPLAPFVLEQTDGTGFLGATRAAPSLNFEKNRAYQVQWYAFAALAAVLFVVMSFRKVSVS
jgi:surfeit locus 1 family protein